MNDHILMFGANRTGHAILKSLQQTARDVVVVDHNPEVIRRLQRQGVDSVYGDIDDHELLAEVGLARAQILVSTVPNTSANLYLIKQARAKNPRALVVVTAEQVEDALAMYDAGADYVVVPHLLGGEQTAQILEGIEAHLGDTRTLRAKRRAHVSTLRRHRAELSS